MAVGDHLRHVRGEEGAADRPLDPGDPAGTAGAYLARQLAVVAAARAAAQASTDAYYAAARAAAGVDGPVPPAAVEPVDPVALVAPLRVTGPVGLAAAQSRGLAEQAAAAAAQQAALGAVQRLVLGAGRDRLRARVAGDRRSAGWARVGDGHPCAFCAMLVGRGAVYRKDTVGFRAHDRCGCTAVAVFDRRSWPGRAEADRLAALWQERVTGHGADGIRQWRAAWDADTRAPGTGAAAARAAAGRAGRRAARGPYPDAALYRPGARTPERLASVRLQISQYERSIPEIERVLAAGDATAAPGLAWQRDRLAELRAEETRLAAGRAGGKGRAAAPRRDGRQGGSRRDGAGTVAVPPRDPPPPRRGGSPDDPDEYPRTVGGQEVPWRPSQRPVPSHTDVLHILDGDPNRPGYGGHRAGTGWGKPEFPANWTDHDILVGIDETLRAPNRIRRKRDTWEFYKLISGLTVVVVVGWKEEAGRYVVTAYPNYKFRW